jgi:hypothetical protein
MTPIYVATAETLAEKPTAKMDAAINTSMRVKAFVAFVAFVFVAMRRRFI